MISIKKNITLICLMVGLCSVAQSKDTQKADKLFEKFEFPEAIKAYSKLIDNGKGNEYVYSQLAEANYLVFNMPEAEKWYARVLETSNDSEIMYRYAQVLKSNGKYEQANNWMQKFATAKPGDTRAKAFNANPDYIQDILNVEKKYEVEALSFNSPDSDFGGTYKDGKLYFASAKGIGGKNYGATNQPFLNVFVIDMKPNDKPEGVAQEVAGDINTKYHEGVVSFSPDGNTMYFSRESHYEKVFEKDRTNKLKIGFNHLFSAKKDGDKWGDVESLPFNGNSFSVKNPAVSPDGKILYFASDMEGGYGGFDIYKVAINDDGTYGKPQNMGVEINTQEAEMFPFISDNGTLYFSSTGHLGLGGLDVFYVAKDGLIKNMGMPINSNSDDFAFTVNEETGRGFVSSNRKGSVGDDDIYAVERLETCDVLVTAIVVDAKNGAAIAEANVDISDGLGNIAHKTSNDDGTVEFTVKCNNPLTYRVTMKDYEGNTIDFLGSDKNAQLEIPLKPIEEIIVEERIVLNPIFFEFDKANITPQGAFELDKLVAVMQKYPDMEVRVESHTDNRGGNQYNIMLSEKRAQATLQYVVSKGIGQDRISGLGRGESQPKVECTKCTEEEHQTNRRSEFIVVSNEW